MVPLKFYDMNLLDLDLSPSTIAGTSECFVVFTVLFTRYTGMSDTFPHCDKILEKINLKKERLILAHSFRGFSLWVDGSIASRHTGQQKRSAEGKLLLSLQPGGKELERKGLGTRYSLQSPVASDYFLQPGPSS
jgi:hypothetical protein